MRVDRLKCSILAGSLFRVPDSDYVAVQIGDMGWSCKASAPESAFPPGVLDTAEGGSHVPVEVDGTVIAAALPRGGAEVKVKLSAVYPATASTNGRSPTPAAVKA